ncbi:hypothetical protein AKO1_007091, partial [Acrasis kona]
MTRSRQSRDYSSPSSPTFDNLSTQAPSQRPDSPLIDSDDSVRPDSPQTIYNRLEAESLISPQRSDAQNKKRAPKDDEDNDDEDDGGDDEDKEVGKPKQKRVRLPNDVKATIVRVHMAGQRSWVSTLKNKEVARIMKTYGCSEQSIKNAVRSATTSAGKRSSTGKGKSKRTKVTEAIYSDNSGSDAEQVPKKRLREHEIAALDEGEKAAMQTQESSASMSTIEEVKKSRDDYKNNTQVLRDEIQSRAAEKLRQIQAARAQEESRLAVLKESNKSRERMYTAMEKMVE